MKYVTKKQEQIDILNKLNERILESVAVATEEEEEEDEEEKEEEATTNRVF